MSAEIRSEAEFFALVHAMESAAAERYAELAEQMTMHNNPETASLFRRLAEIEARHAQEIGARAAAAGHVLAAVATPRGLTELAVEEAPFEEAHYLMTPHHALVLALRNEEQAARIFDAVAQSATDLAVRRLAEAAVTEERRHADLVRAWLAEHPAPARGWEEDPDPPVYSE